MTTEIIKDRNYRFRSGTFPGKEYAAISGFVDIDGDGVFVDSVGRIHLHAVSQLELVPLPDELPAALTLKTLNSFHDAANDFTLHFGDIPITEAEIDRPAHKIVLS